MNRDILQVADALGLELVGSRAHCFNNAGHRHGRDRNPSLSFQVEKGRFRCWSCRVSGDCLDLVQKVLQLPFHEAVAWLDGLPRSRTGLGKPVPSLAVASATPTDEDRLVYQAVRELSPSPTDLSPAGRYLRSRGLDVAISAGIGVGELIEPAAVWAELRQRFSLEELRSAGVVSKRDNFLFRQHPLLFFSLDPRGVAFIQARSLEHVPRIKELSLAGRRPAVPYNALVLGGRLGRLFVCEGCIDTLSAVQLGLPAIGVPGVGSFGDDWFPLIPAGTTVSILFDNDHAGKTHAAELRTRFRLRGFRADAVSVPAGKDVNEFLLSLKKESP